MKTRILLVDDHTLMREGLRKLLEDDFGMEVIGDAEDGSTAIRRAQELSPDIVIMDVSMPGMNGIDATRHIITGQTGVKVIALSTHVEEKYILDMLKAGASGYVIKENSYLELGKAIEAVLHNKMYVSPTIAATLLKNSLDGHSSDQSGVNTILTDKEREVLKLIAEGKSNKEIAEYLLMGIKTVESHRQHLMEKLNLHNVAELTKYAIREGLTSLEK